MTQKGSCIEYFESVWHGWGDHIDGIIEQVEKGLYPIENKGHYKIDVVNRGDEKIVFATVYGKNNTVKFFEWEYPHKDGNVMEDSEYIAERDS